MQFDAKLKERLLKAASPFCLSYSIGSKASESRNHTYPQKCLEIKSPGPMVRRVFCFMLGFG